ERSKIGTFYFVLAAHLLDHQLRVRFNAHGAYIVRFGVVECSDEAVVFSDIVAETADVFFQLSDDFAFGIADEDTVGRRPRIAARATVDVKAMSGRGLGWFGGGLAEEAWFRSSSAFHSGLSVCV